VLEGHRAPRTNARYEQLAERFPTMVKELRRKGVTLQLLWEEYLHELLCAPCSARSQAECHLSGLRMNPERRLVLSGALRGDEPQGRS